MPWWAHTLINGVGIGLVAFLSGTFIGRHIEKKSDAARDALWDVLDKIDWAHQRLKLIEARQHGLETNENERLRWIAFYLEEKSGE